MGRGLSLPSFPAVTLTTGRTWHHVARLPRLTEVRYRDGCRGFTGPIPPPLWMRYLVVARPEAGFLNTVTDQPPPPATGQDAIHLGLWHMTNDPSRLLIVASNRGPLSYSRAADGALTARRGGGGMVSGLMSGLGAVAADGGALWLCAALSDADRAVARQAERPPGTPGEVPVRMLDIPAGMFAAAYNGIA